MTTRKHITLTLDQKVKINKLIENGQNYGMNIEKYKICKLTVFE